MIVECILRAPKRRVLLNEIYKYVQTNYKEMIDKGVDWQNGIRHNLSLNDCFMKDGRNPNGKGYFWTISPKNLPYFEVGDFRRRWSQCRTRRQRDSSEARRQTAYMMSPSGFAVYPTGNPYQDMTSLSTSSLSPTGSSFYDRRPRMCVPPQSDNTIYNANFQTGSLSPNNGYINATGTFYPRPYFTAYHDQTSPAMHQNFNPYHGFIDQCAHSQHVSQLHSQQFQAAQNQQILGEEPTQAVSDRQTDHQSSQERQNPYIDHSMSTIIYRH